MKKNLPLFLILSLLVSGCASSGPKKSSVPAPAQAQPLSSEEAQFGQKIHEQILSSFYPYTEPAVVAYVNKIGNSLAEKAERKDLAYRFTILYSDKIYATSAPGGYVYITTGMMYFLQSEAELAAVLGHEIGQLQYKDPRLSNSKKLLDAITRGGAMVGPAFGEIGALAVLGLAAINAMSERGEMKPEDRFIAADKKAMHYMIEAGYDPQGMIDLFYLFASAEKSVAPYFYDYYQSRPISVERSQALTAEFAKLPLEGKTFSTRQKEYQETTRGIREMYRY